MKWWINRETGEIAETVGLDLPEPWLLVHEGEVRVEYDCYAFRSSSGEYRAVVVSSHREVSRVLRDMHVRGESYEEARRLEEYDRVAAFVIPDFEERMKAYRDRGLLVECLRRLLAQESSYISMKHFFRLVLRLESVLETSLVCEIFTSEQVADLVADLLAEL